MNLKSTLLLIFLVIVINLSSEVLKLSIRYIGIKVVDVTMIDDREGSLQVWAKATSLASIASSLDNYYASYYNDNFLSYQYRKRIDQKDYFEDRIVNYDRSTLIAERTSFIDSTKTCSYPIIKESRDFFSALYSLRSIRENQGELWLDAGKSIWKGTFKEIEKQKIRTIFGKINTRKLEISFQKISESKKERSDMLTNNLVDEQKLLYLWFTDDEEAIPVKAKFKMSPFSVTWKLEEYEK